MNIFDGLTFAEAEKKLEETKNKTLNSINERHTEFNKFMKKHDEFMERQRKEFDKNCRDIESKINNLLADI